MAQYTVILPVPVSLLDVVARFTVVRLALAPFATTIGVEIIFEPLSEAEPETHIGLDCVAEELEYVPACTNNVSTVSERPLIVNVPAPFL